MRHITCNQLNRALQYYDSISSMVEPDIESITKKRGRQKSYYCKNKEFKKIPTDVTTNTGTATPTGFPPIPPPPQRTEDKNQLILTKIKQDVVERKPLTKVGERVGFRGIRLPDMVADQNGA